MRTNSRHLIRTALAIACAGALALAAGCAKDDDGGKKGSPDSGLTPDSGTTPDGAAADTGTTPDGMGGKDAAAKFTFDAMFNGLFAKGCNRSGCHSAADKAGGLDLSSADAAYKALVGAASNAKGPCKGWTLVVAKDAQKSLFYRKLADATPPCGKRMPIGAAPLPSAMTDKIKAWIMAGAPRK